MARQAGMDDPLYAISDPILVGLIAELSSDDGRRSASQFPLCSCRRFWKHAARASLG